MGQEGHVANNHTPVKKAMEKLTADIVAWRRPSQTPDDELPVR
ncbi:hypothetical protein EC09BKT78844_2756 [Escherichia coli 09BKT078844]|nr:hypothetical protein ECDEC1E_2203 [Escherichia coli DEC1E]EHU92289.1 hypothetical protein ECDEC4A_2491 [Escherichia coli DEC4A]EHY05118.1 hypothetical protein ECDEC15B_2122 [Escherichia coli DEC15B]EIN24269.1 hypothetical protein ECFDA517_2914 [Escherichia coli FDA517]EIN88376.1 hypothetical protein ECPA22_2691 [Escherichia coli PA22]EIO16781.1 hypothetical protein ECPA31_2526 [Escherichia coli PA31]EIO28785.1 hypothetical protein ECPA40_2847 [Escherichia coli PA40]EIP12507.1 hypothetical